jgi:pantoate--beta-alanine ligase
MSASTSTHIPVYTTIEDYRIWRNKAFEDKKSVGFVPTMGALHDGHLSLGSCTDSRIRLRADATSVKRSLVENDLTVVSIFVNPAQFAPHEDLATYPRTLLHDLSLLSTLECQPTDVHPSRTPSAVFVPSVKDMYPSGISQDVAEQTGTFVEVKGYGEQMEGRSRPTFFRGVATVVAKLFNIIQVRTVPGVNIRDECSSVLSQPTHTSVRRTSNRHSSCAVLLAICTLLTLRPAGCTSSLLRVTL